MGGVDTWSVTPIAHGTDVDWTSVGLQGVPETTRRKPLVASDTETQHYFEFAASAETLLVLSRRFESLISFTSYKFFGPVFTSTNRLGRS